MEESILWAQEVLEKVRKKMAWVSEKNCHKIPYTTDLNGDYDDRADLRKTWNQDDGLNWWTNGFWGGMMWLLYQDTKEERYIEIARYSMKKMEQCFVDFYGLHHDVGFMFVPTAVMDYRLTGNEDAKRIGMHAANLLAGRFNPVGKFIRAWNEVENSNTVGWAIIDCMFNISLLYWATEESNDPRFKQIAMMHADTVMENFIRSDGSVCHIVEFNPETGEKVQSHGGQGYDKDSSWTRGQGWALYGFVNSYFHTGKKEYLDTAKKVAKYCLANISEDGIIPVDFRQPKEPEWEDSCGACIIAGGLIELARYADISEKETYLEAAIKILKTITEKRADFTQNCDAIVQNCSASYHGNMRHITMSYADFFYIEALYKITDIGDLIW